MVTKNKKHPDAISNNSQEKHKDCFGNNDYKLGYSSSSTPRNDNQEIFKITYYYILQE
ncbi:hypothetical protein [Crocosphaera chwakensis]|uniref:Uncharacterized protein n=1 Tax=Crocosphaera chwakensis CCY0110 TaxID=391612 RepID=A3ILR0_9CHRO|nr:hypothetical protein [Crocosphaera chwakensis]EAZ92711.1 hypothetical protein CY0110_24131 [Crocosphaera chwakensis CCY0110]